MNDSNPRNEKLGTCCWNNKKCSRLQILQRKTDLKIWWEFILLHWLLQNFVLLLQVLLHSFFCRFDLMFITSSLIFSSLDSTSCKML
jgi:hypothetical protein